MKAEEVGYRAEVILAGRRTNDGMGKFIAEKAVKKMIETGRTIKNAHVLIKGLTFKEDCPDLRNSKIEDIINELKDYGVNVTVVDPIADKQEAMEEYGVELKDLSEVKDVDSIILGVAHKEYKELDISELKRIYKKDISAPILIDVKGILNKEEIKKQGFVFWRM